MAGCRGALLLHAVILAVQLLTTAAINLNVCLPNIPTSHEKKFPNIPNEFEGSYTWNSLGSNQTFFVREVFSEELNIGIMLVEDLIGPGVQSKLYSYGETNEFVYIPDYDGRYGGDCVSGDLTANDFAFPFNKVSGQDHLVSGKDVLLMGVKEAAMVYKGTDTIDDIEVDVFNGCLYAPQTDTTYNATYYFTLNTTDGNRWRTASGLTSAIKRIHVLQDNGQGTNPAESTHEYYYFAGQLPPMTPENLKYYEPPLGAYCSQRKTNKPLPQVGDFFSFYSEVYDPINNIITYTDEWYDFTSNMSRIDHNEMEDRGNLSQPVKIVHDYETGLSYHIQKYSGGCEIRSILSDSFDNVADPNGFVRMRNPKEFFDFDKLKKYKWVYEGSFVERGVECEVWICKRPYPTEDQTTMGYWEWYFTDTAWRMSVGDVLEDLEPFKMVITVPEKNIKTEYNIYNFKQEAPEDKFFDVEDCFDQHNESRTYGFIMRATVDQYKLDQHEEMLKYWISFSIQIAAGIRAIQVHNIQLQYDVTRVFVEFTLLGSPNVQGDVKNPLAIMDLDTAESLLVSAINNETFVIYFSQGKKEIQFRVTKKSFCRIEHKGDNSVYYIINDNGKDLTQLETIVKQADVGPGGVAGIVISMLVLGVALVAVPFVFVTKKKKELQSFNRSQLTMSEMTD